MIRLVFLLPKYPEVQLHVKPLLLSNIAVPPFRHGLYRALIIGIYVYINGFVNGYRAVFLIILSQLKPVE